MPPFDIKPQTILEGLKKLSTGLQKTAQNIRRNPLRKKKESAVSSPTPTSSKLTEKLNSLPVSAPVSQPSNNIPNTHKSEYESVQTQQNPFPPQPPMPTDLYKRFTAKPQQPPSLPQQFQHVKPQKTTQSQDLFQKVVIKPQQPQATPPSAEPLPQLNGALYQNVLSGVYKKMQTKVRKDSASQSPAFPYSAGHSPNTQKKTICILASKQNNSLSDGENYVKQYMSYNDTVSQEGFIEESAIAMAEKIKKNSNPLAKKLSDQLNNNAYLADYQGNIELYCTKL